MQVDPISVVFLYNNRDKGCPPVKGITEWTHSIDVVLVEEPWPFPITTYHFGYVVP